MTQSEFRTAGSQKSGSDHRARIKTGCDKMPVTHLPDYVGATALIPYSEKHYM
jgi:hypothetical protein